MHCKISYFYMRITFTKIHVKALDKNILHSMEKSRGNILYGKFYSAVIVSATFSEICMSASLQLSNEENNHL